MKAVLVLALLCTTALAADRSTAPGPVVAFQFPDRWLGLTPQSLLLEARISADAQFLTRARARSASTSEVGALAGIVRRLIDQLPPERAMEANDTPVSGEPSFVRCNIWLGNQTVEYDVQGIRSAAPLLRELFDALEELLNNVPETNLPAVLMAQSLDRRFGPEQTSYAEGHRHSGQTFTPLNASELASAPAPVQLSFAHPGALGVADAGLLAWLEANDKSEPTRGFFRSDDRHFQLLLWQGNGAAFPQTSPAHPKSGKISQPAANGVVTP